MYDDCSIAWFFWDPPREAFTIPFFNHSVVWYGILFVTGFILAYFIINPIWVRFLQHSRHLSSLDILHWPQLLQRLRTSTSPFISQFMGQCDPTTRQQLLLSAPLTPTLQKGILEGLNRLLHVSSVNREDLQQTFAPALASPKQTAYLLTDRLLWFVVLGTIIGARLGTVLFYDWPYFSQHPLDIFKVWQGGLASHGGFIGVILSLYLYLKYVHQWLPSLTFLRLLDFVAIPTILVCGFIRLGNLMNQEILGTPTDVPWAFLFGHPVDGSAVTPRHPIQIYEALAYFFTFFLVWRLWKNHWFENQPGAFLGLIFILGFGSRFILEFWKSTQESFLQSSFLQMGQILSLPFIALGAFLLLKPSYCSKNCSEN